MSYTPEQIRIAKEWVRRLRSPHYKQGRSALKTTRSQVVEYCCLGILCEIARESNVVTELLPTVWSDGRSSFASVLTPGDKSATQLPEAVAEWAGIPVNPEYGDKLLAILNDNGTTFPAIATLIEAMYGIRSDTDALQ